MKKKIVAAALACVLCVGLGVGGTLAWLVDDTETVTNVFSVGDINVSLAEEHGPSFKIVPGTKQTKDPVITVESTSEKCYVYACVENNVVLDGEVVATTNISNTDWAVVGSAGNKTVYRYVGDKATNNVVDAASAAVELPVFTEVSYSNTIEKGDKAALENKTIVVQGYAHQSEGEGMTQAFADAAAKTYFGI